MENNNSITVRNLSKRFGRFTAVDSIDFDVRKGEIFGFLGANGAGKSTTIRMLCGLLSPTSGQATVASYDVKKNPEKVKQHIGYMSQKFSLYGDLTVNENISFFGSVYRLAYEKIRHRGSEILKLLDLEDKKNILSNNLPRGFQQRLAFACAILHDPEIIFLDEPTAGVDPVQRRNFWDLLNDFSAKGTTIFVTTHFLDEAEFCHRIAFIVNGKIVASDTPTGLKSILSDFEMLEIECEPVVKALEIVQKEKWLKGASLFGSAIHVTAPGMEGNIEKITLLLSSNNISVISIEPVEPSLEDAFLYMAEEKNNAIIRDA
jgi:ABC-2 type transport system ATP-binding protein